MGFGAEDKLVIMGLMGAAVLIFLMINIKHLYVMTITAVIVVLPLTNMKMMPRSVLGIQGLSLVNIVWLGAFVLTAGILIVQRKKLYLADYFLGPLVILTAVYFFAVLRTMLDLPSLKGAFPELVLRKQNVFPTGFAPRLLEDFVKPLQLMLVGWIAMVGCHLKGRETVQRALMISAMVTGVLVLWFFFRGAVESGSFDAARSAISRNLGMHGNSIGRIGVLLFLGFLFVRSESSPLMRLLAMASILMVVGASLSRTSIITLVFSILLFYRYIEKKERKLVLIMIGLAGVILSGALIERMQYGFNNDEPVYSNQTEQLDYSKISAGRLDGVWAPLFPTIEENLLFGQGLHSIRRSDAARTGGLHVFNSHSSYMQLLLDSGLIGLVLVVSMMVILFKQSKPYRNELHYVLVPILILGITGVTFYPDLAFYVFFIYYGLHRYDYIHAREKAGLENV